MKSALESELEASWRASRATAAAVRLERERCAAWAKLYFDGALTDDYEMYVGIRDGKPAPAVIAKAQG